MATKRRLARQLALALLYQHDIAGGDADTCHFTRLRWPFRGPEGDEEPGIQELGNAFDTREVREFASVLADGAIAHLEAIDLAISERSQHWKLNRMPVVDRNILRLGVYEILYRKDIPPKVTIDEAVSLAKDFCEEGSGAFINGILDNLAATLNKA